MSQILLRIHIGLLSLCLAACAARQPMDTEQAGLHYKIGTNYLHQGKYPKALQELQIALELDPENPYINNNSGVVYFLLEKYSESEKYFRRAVALKPKYAEARNNLGRTLVKLGLYNEAITHLEIIKKDLTYSNPEQALSSLGMAYFHKKDYKKAQSNLFKSLKIRRSHCSTRNYYARSLFEQNKLKKAGIAFDQAASICKDQLQNEALYYSGLTFFKKGDVEDAEARFKEVIAKTKKGKYNKLSMKMLKILKESK